MLGIVEGGLELICIARGDKRCQVGGEGHGLRPRVRGGGTFETGQR